MRDIVFGRAHDFKKVQVQVRGTLMHFFVGLPIQRKTNGAQDSYSVQFDIIIVIVVAIFLSKAKQCHI